MGRPVSTNLHPSQSTKRRVLNRSTVVDDEEIYKAKIKGQTNQQIADELRISLEQVRHALSTRMDIELSRESPESRLSILNLERERLDHIQAAHWEMAMAGDRISTDAVLKVIALRIKLEKLDQLDPETQANTVLVVAGSEREYIQALKESGSS